MKKIFIYCLLLFTFQAIIPHAQSAILTSGTDASGSNGLIFHSMDQTIFARDQNYPDLFKDKA